MITSSLKYRNQFPFDVSYHRSLTDEEAIRVARNVRIKHARDLKRIFKFLKAENLLINPITDRKRLFRSNPLPRYIELLPKSTEFYLAMPSN